MANFIFDNNTNDGNLSNTLNWLDDIDIPDTFGRNGNLPNTYDEVYMSANSTGGTLECYDLYVSPQIVLGTNTNGGDVICNTSSSFNNIYVEDGNTFSCYDSLVVPEGIVGVKSAYPGYVCCFTLDTATFDITTSDRLEAVSFIWTANTNLTALTYGTWTFSGEIRIGNVTNTVFNSCNVTATGDITVGACGTFAYGSNIEAATIVVASTSTNFSVSSNVTANIIRVGPVLNDFAVTGAANSVLVATGYIEVDYVVGDFINSTSTVTAPYIYVGSRYTHLGPYPVTTRCIGPYPKYARSPAGTVRNVIGQFPCSSNIVPWPAAGGRIGPWKVSATAIGPYTLR